MSYPIAERRIRSRLKSNNQKYWFMWSTAVDVIFEHTTVNVWLARESMFSQTIALPQVLSPLQALQTAQITILIVCSRPDIWDLTTLQSFYFFAVNNLSSSKPWSDGAIQLLQECDHHNLNTLTRGEDQALKSRLLCSAFVLEKQVIHDYDDVLMVNSQSDNWLFHFRTINKKPRH